MNELYIDQHAFKHGISAEDIEYAWEHFVARRHRSSPNEHQIVAVGYDARGRFIQMVASEHSCGTVIYHAMEPPTKNVLIELGLDKGRF